MRDRRWPRIVVLSLVGLAVLAGLTIFAFRERPVTTPRYPAQAWAGQGGTHSGWLDADIGESSICWYVADGSAKDPTFRIGLVLPDTYRAFKLSLVERGMHGPGPFISGPSLWAGEPVAKFQEGVTLVGRPAVGDGWLADARAEWDRLCDPSVESVIVVQPGTLALTN